MPLLLIALLAAARGGDGPGTLASSTVDTVAGVEELAYPETAGPQLGMLDGDTMAAPIPL